MPPPPPPGAPTRRLDWRALFRPIDLADPGEPDPGRGPGRLSRLGGVLRRPPVVLGVLVVLVGTAGVVRLDVRVHDPSEVVDAATLVEVIIDPGRVGASGLPGHSGTYLTPTSTLRPTVLVTAIAALRPGLQVAPVDPLETLDPATMAVPGLDPVGAALLLAAGVAPGRGDPTALGMSADIDLARVAPTALGLQLEIVDRASTFDLAKGRVVLALGTVGAGGELACPEEVGASLDAASGRGPDVVVIPPACADEVADVSRPRRIVAPTLPDAVSLLSAS